jgi:hypothetical protein
MPEKDKEKKEKDKSTFIGSPKKKLRIGESNPGRPGESGVS